MTTVTYLRSSPYYRTPQNTTYLDFWRPPLLTRTSDDLIVTLAQRHLHRPDLLSFELYRNPRAWWAFAILNPDQIVDPIYDFVPGITIYAPSQLSIGSTL
jgi:hypothetical protein